MLGLTEAEERKEGVEEFGLGLEEVRAGYQKADAKGSQHRSDAGTRR